MKNQHIQKKVSFQQTNSFEPSGYLQTRPFAPINTSSSIDEQTRPDLQTKLKRPTLIRHNFGEIPVQSPTKTPVIQRSRWKQAFKLLGLGASVGVGGFAVHNSYQQNQVLSERRRVPSSSRLGALHSTRNFSNDQLGSGVNTAIRGIHTVLGDIGEEQIGLYFNHPKIQKLLSETADDKVASLAVATGEYKYWEHMKEQGSFGGILGASVQPEYRARIQHFFAGKLKLALQNILSEQRLSEIEEKQFKKYMIDVNQVLENILNKKNKE